jgi:hypothetical protein
VDADTGQIIAAMLCAPRTKGRQMIEVAITVASLNRMLELGRRDYIRLV